MRILNDIADDIPYIAYIQDVQPLQHLVVAGHDKLGRNKYVESLSSGAESRGRILTHSLVSVLLLNAVFILSHDRFLESLDLITPQPYPQTSSEIMKKRVIVVLNNTRRPVRGKKGTTTLLEDISDGSKQQS